MNMYYATPCKIVELRAYIDEVYIHYDSVCILQTNGKGMKRYIGANGLRMYYSANTHKSKRGMHLGS